MVVWCNNVTETLDLRWVIDLLPLHEMWNQTNRLYYPKLRDWVIEHYIPYQTFGNSNVYLFRYSISTKRSLT